MTLLIRNPVCTGMYGRCENRSTPQEVAYYSGKYPHIRPGPIPESIGDTFGDTDSTHCALYSRDYVGIIFSTLTIKTQNVLF